jgi:hypothetical protein
MSTTTTIAATTQHRKNTMSSYSRAAGHILWIMIHGSYSGVSRKKAKSLGNVQRRWWVMICCREISAKKLLDMYLRNNDTGDETGLDVASGSVEPFGVVSGANISLLQPHLQCQNQLNFSLSVPRSSSFCTY